MKRSSLLSLLDSYVPADDLENEMYHETIQFVTNNPECFERTLQIGHITASGWVVSPEHDQVLLMHHRKLERWFQPGGHADGDPDVLHVAEKEVEEETGASNLKLAKEGIFDVDVHLIPANSKDPAHYHYDIRFVFEADPKAELVINSESKDVRWVPVQEIVLLNDSESLMRMVRKTSAL
jgi:8-oxo-dGTP pyrophosphatase MutT (NUDIX family)